MPPTTERMYSYKCTWRLFVLQRCTCVLRQTNNTVHKLQSLRQIPSVLPARFLTGTLVKPCLRLCVYLQVQAKLYKTTVQVSAHMHTKWKNRNIKQTPHLVAHSDGHALSFGADAYVARDRGAVGGLLQTEVTQHVFTENRAGVEGGAKVVALPAQRLWRCEALEVGNLRHVVQVGPQIGQLCAHRDLGKVEVGA